MILPGLCSCVLIEVLVVMEQYTRGAKKKGSSRRAGKGGASLRAKSFSSEGSSEATQSLPSFECDSDSLGGGGPSSASSSSDYTNSSSDEDVEAPTTATPAPAPVILGDRTPSLSEPVIKTPVSLSAVSIVHSRPLFTHSDRLDARSE
jgi:hypothetical protein